MAPDDAETLLFQLDGSSGTTNLLCRQVSSTRWSQCLRAALVLWNTPAPGSFDQISLQPLRLIELGRAEGLTISPPLHREVRPVAVSPLPQAHDARPASSSATTVADDVLCVSTRHPSMNWSRSDGRYRTARPNRTNWGPVPRCLQARRVATESPSWSAASISFMARSGFMSLPPQLTLPAVRRGRVRLVAAARWSNASNGVYPPNR